MDGEETQKNNFSYLLSDNPNIIHRRVPCHPSIRLYGTDLMRTLPSLLMCKKLIVLARLSNGFLGLQVIARRKGNEMGEVFSEPLKRYWFYEMIDDQEFRELLIVDDIAQVLQACGYPKPLAVSKAFNVFYNLGLWRVI